MPTESGENAPALPSDGSHLRQIGFLPLLAIFYGYTAGGPFGYEGIFHDSGPGMAILGSGSIVSQLASQGLIDEYQVVVNTIVLGKGRTMFDGIKEKLSLRPTKTQTFGNGNVYLCYEPAA